jgi:DNA-binding response OmpR family regulator
MFKKRIMLVDDEERFLQTTRKLLAKNGYEVITASGGLECLQKLEEEFPHVIVLDVKMPDLDGMETLKRIKRKHPMIQVIMLTGHATAEAAMEGIKSGATDYLIKPADIRELIAKIEAAFQRRRELENQAAED